MSDDTPDTSLKWIVGVIGAVICGLMVGGWASTTSEVRSTANRIATLEGQAEGREKRLAALEAYLVRIDAKLDRILEKK